MILTGVFYEQYLVLPNIAYYIVFCKILLTRRIFHPNLLLIFLVMPLTPLLALTTKVFLVTAAMFEMEFFTELNSIMYTISDTLLACHAFTLFTLSVERVVATLMVNRYENFCKRIPWLTLMLYSTQVIAACVLVPSSKSNRLSGTVVLGIVFTTFAMAFIVFVSLPYVSRRVYEKAAFSNISNRYQSVENLRSVKVLRLLVPYTFICNIVFVIAFAFLFGLFYQKELENFMRFYFCLLEFQVMGTMSIILFTQRTFRKEISEMCGKVTETTEDNVLGVTGKRMIHGTDQQRDIYFTTYQAAWHSTPRQSVTIVKTSKK